MDYDQEDGRDTGIDLFYCTLQLRAVSEKPRTVKAMAKAHNASMRSVAAGCSTLLKSLRSCGQSVRWRYPSQQVAVAQETIFLYGTDMKGGLTEFEL
jgi:hypothetical protein